MTVHASETALATGLDRLAASASSPRGVPLTIITTVTDAPARRQDGRIVYKFVRAGTAQFASSFGTFKLAAGDVLALDAGLAYEIIPDLGYEATRVGFDRRYIIDQLYWLYTGLLPDRIAAAHLLDAIYHPPIHHTHLTAQRQHRVCKILDRLEDALTEPGKLEHHARAMSLSWALITELGDFHAATPLDSGPLHTLGLFDPAARRTAPRAEARTIAELLTAQPEAPWTVQELAARVHLSPSQFRRIFTATYGIPPGAYLARARAHRMATHLTERPNLTISEAARLAGWNSRTHATAAFTQHHGTTPTNYRARNNQEREE